ncbi:MAG: hypothetical protein JXA97_01815 [Anaerolineales bacterium]|nr:hypothetical protein [Anaerolineales bacterium]
MKIQAAIFLMLMLFLQACTTQPQGVEESSPTHTASPSLTPTTTPLPSETPAPTITPTPTISPTPTRPVNLSMQEDGLMLVVDPVLGYQFQLPEGWSVVEESYNPSPDTFRLTAMYHLLRLRLTRSPTCHNLQEYFDDIFAARESQTTTVGQAVIAQYRYTANRLGTPIVIFEYWRVLEPLESRTYAIVFQPYPDAPILRINIDGGRATFNADERQSIQFIQDSLLFLDP